METLASDIIDREMYNEIEGYIASICPTGEREVMALFCLRALTAKLEYRTGIPHFEVDYEPKEDDE